MCARCFAVRAAHGLHQRCGGASGLFKRGSKNTAHNASTNNAASAAAPFGSSSKGSGGASGSDECNSLILSGEDVAAASQLQAMLLQQSDYPAGYRVSPPQSDTSGHVTQDASNPEQSQQVEPAGWRYSNSQRD